MALPDLAFFTADDPSTVAGWHDLGLLALVGMIDPPCKVAISAVFVMVGMAGNIRLRLGRVADRRTGKIRAGASAFHVKRDRL